MSKRSINDLLCSESATLRINPSCLLRRWKHDALGQPCDCLRVEFTYNHYGRLAKTEPIAARDFEGIVQECSEKLEAYMKWVSDELVKAMKSGYWF